MLLLIAAGAAEGINKVRDRGAARRNRPLQHRANLGMQARSIDRLGWRQRMHSRGEQRFIAINVS